MTFQETTVKDGAVTPITAARRLGYGLNYVYMLIWSGDLEARKRDGRWEIPAEAVEERAKRRSVELAASEAT